MVCLAKTGDFDGHIAVSNSVSGDLNSISLSFPPASLVTVLLMITRFDNDPGNYLKSEEIALEDSGKSL